MTDYAPNATARLWCDYRCFGSDHTFMWRGVLGSDVTDMENLAGKAITFLNELAPNLIASWAIRGWRYALEGSNVSLPLSPAGTFSGGGASEPDAGNRYVKVRTLGFVGRSVNGHPGGFYIFGTNFNQEGGVGVDFRVTPTEYALLGDVITVLDEVAPAIAAGDGAIIAWKQYANLKDNDYYVKKVRRGG